MRLTQKIITLASGGLGAIVLTAVTIKPEDADSNLAAWMNAVGVENPPSSLVSTHADQLAFWLAILLLAIFAIGLSEWIFNRGWITQHISWRFRLKPPQVTPAITDQANAITPASHKGKPLVRLTDGERARLSAALLAVDEYLKGPLAAFLQPLRELRNYQSLLQTLGAGEFHRMVEAPRPTMRQFIDAYAEFAKPHLVETAIVDIDLMAIKTKSLPLWEALREVSDVSQALAPDSIQPSPLKPVMRAFDSVLDELGDQVNLIQRQVDENRQKLARGELG